MKISPKYTDDDWNELSLNFSFSNDWIKGADIVHDRIHGRYLAQIESLENHLNIDIWEYSGFLIMGVDCMVIETLNQFHLGISDTDKVYRGRNRESFRDFFLRSPFFSGQFDDVKSFVFYDQVRNGLVHQAQTKKGTLINFQENEMIKEIDSSNIEEGIIVNRILFHEALVNEFKSYTTNLKTENPSYDELRKKCIDKMKTIC